MPTHTRHDDPRPPEGSLARLVEDLLYNSPVEVFLRTATPRQTAADRLGLAFPEHERGKDTP